MEIYLLSNKAISCHKYTAILSGGMFVQTFPKQDIDLKPVAGEPGLSYCNRLSTYLIENASAWKLKPGHLDWTLQLQVGVPLRVGEECFIRVQDDPSSETGFLRRLVTLFNKVAEQNVSLKLDITDFRMDRGNGIFLSEVVVGTTSLTSSGLAVKQAADGGGFGCQFSFKLLEDKVHEDWLQGKRRFKGNLKLILMLNDSHLNDIYVEGIPPGHRYWLMKKLLNDEDMTDVEIVANNGDVAKCHKAILANISPVLRAMFGNQMTEPPTNSVEMAGMSNAASLKAFLAFLYHREVKVASSDSQVAFELLRGGHCYKVDELVDAMQELLLVKPCEWYSVDDTVETLLFSTKQLDDGKDTEESTSSKTWEDLKKKSVQVLKWYSKNEPNMLLQSAKYDRMFWENPRLGKQVGTMFLEMA